MSPALDDDTRLLRWLRREVNRDLRRWRDPVMCAALDEITFRVADCKAKLELIRWAESWQRVRGPDYAPADRPDVQGAMIGKLEMIMHAVRYVAGGYRNREGYRPEWDHAR